jgi:hypothetical protein
MTRLVWIATIQPSNGNDEPFEWKPLQRLTLVSGNVFEDCEAVHKPCAWIELLIFWRAGFTGGAVDNMHFDWPGRPSGRPLRVCAATPEALREA